MLVLDVIQFQGNQFLEQSQSVRVEKLCVHRVFRELEFLVLVVLERILQIDSCLFELPEFHACHSAVLLNLRYVLFLPTPVPSDQQYVLKCFLQMHVGFVVVAQSV